MEAPDIETLVLEVASDLIAMYPNEKSTSSYGLMFPEKRDGKLRISEQESKLLFVQRLTVGRWLFSVETPTRETYIQSGTHPLSARIDLTLYNSERQAETHIELKAHNCPVENIRKDLEKLFREGRTGVWFHTLEREDRGQTGLLRKFREAFAKVEQHFSVDEQRLLIVFVVLDSGVCYRKWLRFTTNSLENRKVLDHAFESITTDGWIVQRFRSAPLRAETSGGGKGARSGFFVLIPSVAPETFLHLSVRGGSYRLRKFVRENGQVVVRPFVLPAYKSFQGLKDSGVITRWIDVTADDLSHTLEDEPEYWFNRIRKLNGTGLANTARA